MFSLRTVASAAPRATARRAWQPIVRTYASDTTAAAPESPQAQANAAVAAEASPSPAKPAPKPAPKPIAKAIPKKPLVPANKATYRPPPPPRPDPRLWASSTIPASSKEAEEIDWTTSFRGASTQPVSREQYNVLIQPIADKDIEVKPDGVMYLPEIKYRRRLNEAFGPMGWSLVPRSEPAVGDAIVTREYALVVNGRFASQALGENSYFSAEQLPSAVEGCKSNALMRCCKDLGIASELWDPEFIRQFKKTKMKDAWVEHATTKKKRTMWFKAGQVNPVYPWKLVS